MGNQFSSARNAVEGLHDAELEMLAYSLICMDTGIRTDEYALEIYGRYKKDLCQQACRYLVNYYNTWMHTAKMLLILLRALEEKRNMMGSSILETCRRMILHYRSILRVFDMPDRISMVIPQVLFHFEANESDVLSTAISLVLHELDLKDDWNRGAVVRRLFSGNQYLPVLRRIISQALAEIDLNGHENGEAIEYDRAAAEGDQEQN